MTSRPQLTGARRCSPGAYPVVLELEVLTRGFTPAEIVEAIKERFDGGADPFSGTQVFFGGTYTAGHMMARTRNAILLTDAEVKITQNESSG